jgi:hypothetical protein
MSLYTDCVALGVKISNHETDLYIPVTPETKKLIEAYKFRSSVTTFVNQVEGGLWYDIPFAYEPEWAKRTAKA